MQQTPDQSRHLVILCLTFVVLGGALLGASFILPGAKGTLGAIANNASAPASAEGTTPEVLRYTDSKGVKHYVSSLSQVPDEFKNQVEDHQLPNINKIPSSPNGGKTTTATSSQSKVEIFVTSWCPYCRALEDFLNKEKITYTKYDIEKNSKGRSIHQELGGGGIPVTRIDGSTVIRGYSPDAILAAIKKQA